MAQGETSSDKRGGILRCGLHVGYHAVLFYGLTLTERIDVTDGITLLPFEQFRSFVDNRLVEELSPPGGGIPSLAVDRGGGEALPMEAHVPLVGPRRGVRESPDLLGTARRCPRHAGALPRSVGLLYGPLREPASGRRGLSWRYYRARAAQGFDGFDECPGLAPEAFVEAKKAFDNRTSEPFDKMAPIIGRLAD